MVNYRSLTDTHKGRIARKAASKYISKPNAVREYICTSGIVDLLPRSHRKEPSPEDDLWGVALTLEEGFYSFSPEKRKSLQESFPDLGKAAKIYRDAEEEMLRLLPIYRHPVSNALAERMIFLAVDSLDGGATVQVKTQLMMDVAESVNEPLCGAILEELESYAQTKSQLETVVKENEGLKNIRDNVRTAYQPRRKGEAINSRQKRVIRELGLSDGKRRKTFDPESLYRKYVHLVRRKNFNRVDAILDVAKQHNISMNTALKALHNVRADVKKRIKQNFHEDIQQITLPYLRGLIPDKRDIDAAI